jgi:hypothetical protein
MSSVRRPSSGSQRLPSPPVSAAHVPVSSTTTSEADFGWRPTFIVHGDATGGRPPTSGAHHGPPQAAAWPREAAKQGVLAGSTGRRKSCSEVLLVTHGSSSGALIRMRSLVRFQLAPLP